MPDRNRSTIYSGLLAWLREINGLAGGYWYDLSERVYTRLVLPEDDAGLPSQYLCAPLDGQSAERIEEFGNAAMKASWVQPVYGFIRDPSTTLRDADAIGVLKLRDDLMRRFHSDYTVGGLVEDMTVESLVIFGAERGTDYAEILLQLRMSAWTKAANLGPIPE